jgi:hypothetical protein
MARSSVSFKTPPEIRRWARGMRDFEGNLIDAAMVHWHAAADVMFGRSQEYVHIVSGNLKSSGRSRVVKLMHSVYCEIIYGGADVVYAQIEEDRGGDHAFLSRAFEATESTFSASMTAIFNDAMDRSK